jgi:hypothetical protein
MRADSKLIILTPEEITFLQEFLMGDVQIPLESGCREMFNTIYNKLKDAENVYAPRR